MITDKELVERYNALLARSDYDLQARINLVEYLHRQGMRYREIYAIAEAPIKSDQAVA